MGERRSLGRAFGWLWSAYAVSTLGTCMALDAFPLIAVIALHAGPAQVSLLAAAGLAVGAVVALPLGPWVEFRRKRPVMIAMDVARCVALLSVPAAYALGRLTFAQLLVVSVAVAAADIAFRSASGACLKALVPPGDLLVANGRFESTTWTATALGPPLGGAAIGLLGPVTTVVANAVSYLLSALALRAIPGKEQRPARREGVARPRAGELLEGWRYILGHPTLRPLFLHHVLFSGLLMATAPLLFSLMIGELGFAPWQYGLAFGIPCLGGLLGARLAPPLVARHGRHRVLFVSGTLRVCWPLGLVLMGPGAAGLLLVIGVEFALITCIGVFNPVFATYRLAQTADDRVARTLAAWTVTGNAARAALTALAGLLAGVAGTRGALAAVSLVLMATPLLLPRGDRAHRDEPERAKSPSEHLS